MALARAPAAIHLPVGQLASAGVVLFAISNPDKFFTLIGRTSQFLAEPSSSSNRSQAPIVIHHGGAIQPKTWAGSIVQLALGATFCWGSYVVLISMLPEAAKGMLPVTNNVFNKAVTSLGRAIINLKDTLMEQVRGLSKKQDELRDKQQQTHFAVLEVKGSINDVRGDLGLVQESLDLCHASLSESEKRTSYIAEGVRLLTRGVSTFLPENDSLLRELVRFNSAGEQFHSPAQLQQLHQVLEALSTSQSVESSAPPPNTPPRMIQTTYSSDPENEVPLSPNAVEQSVSEVRALLDSFGYGKVQ